MRGLPGHAGDLRAEFRIIPARAGFTTSPLTSAPRGGDHPRSRGVYMVVSLPPPSGGGSSPLARGLHGLVEGQSLADGIIPARAGFTRWTVMPAGSRSDHPRSRGVYVEEFIAQAIGAGSSPLARGLPGGLSRERAPARIIPARAGFTKTCVSLHKTPSDHPRSRGVYCTSRSTSTTEPGSSPLARGLPDGSPFGRVVGGIIPARAGFTAWSASPWAAPKDHPRSRGVYPRGPGRPGPHVGSSPLARGLPR